jgi:integrase
MLLRLHIMPWFGDLALDRITPPMVRSWRTDLLRQGRSESTAAELMHRMGHASMRAALIYQHATSKRDREIVAAIDARIGRGSDS